MFDKVIPILRILDVAKAREFYIDFLGFTVDWEHRFDDNAPLYMQVSRAGLLLHLSEHYGDAIPGAAFRIKMTGVHDLQRELVEKKYRYFRPGVERMEWGTDEMQLIDPFGNRLTFAEDVKA